MVGKTHKNIEKNAINYFNKKDYKLVTINNLSSTIEKLSGSKSGSKPDLVMIKHDLQNDSLETGIQLPHWIGVVWVEIIISNFQGFPTKADVTKSLYHTLRWKDLYSKEVLRSGFLGSKIKTEQVLHDILLKKTRISVDFYIFQENSIWYCEQKDHVPMNIRDF